jgi:phosphoribosylformylglycinamidine cyclo-ligase
MSPTAAYTTFNMGCGFAVYCAAGSGPEVVRLAAEAGLSAAVAGTVEDGPRRVVLEPVDVVYESGAMDLTPGG